MEDMKKMIERYKKELLEYSKASSTNEPEVLKQESPKPSANSSADVQEQTPTPNVYERQGDFEPKPAVSERKKPSVIS